MIVTTARVGRLLSCGAAAALVYVGTDLLASWAYPGYSYRGQAVSELFAIGAPTRLWVAIALSASSLLLFAFSLGIWAGAGTSRLLRALAIAFAGSALIGLLIWIVYPMHMRGEPRTFTDRMHLILASNPFVLLTLAIVIAAIPGRFRIYTVATVVLMLASAIPAFSYAKALDRDQATPWLGTAERLSQYTYALWQILLASRLQRAIRERSRVAA